MTAVIMPFSCLVSRTAGVLPHLPQEVLAEFIKACQAVGPQVVQVLNEIPKASNFPFCADFLRRLSMRSLYPAL